MVRLVALAERQVGGAARLANGRGGGEQHGTEEEVGAKGGTRDGRERRACGEHGRATKERKSTYAHDTARTAVVRRCTM